MTELERRMEDMKKCIEEECGRPYKDNCEHSYSCSICKLVKAGYKKVDFQSRVADIMKWKQEVRKETAKEVAKKIKLLFYYNFDEIIPSIMESAIDKLLEEEYGVKTGVDENDKNQS